MASEIKVDTIVNAGGDNDTGIDLATNDQILLKVANATKLTMNSTGQTTIVGEGGTTTTSVQQGLAKAWVTFDGTATNTPIADSLNVSSVDDDDTGDYGVNFQSAMVNTNYSCTFGDGEGSATSGMRFLNDAGSTTSSQEIYGRNVSNSAADCNAASVAIRGDLA